MNVKQLTYIIALAEEGNTSKAAKRTGISQSALSKYLLTLESSLGVSLFTRSERKLTPTFYGKVYIDAAREVLQTYEYTCQAVKGLSLQEKQIITIGYASEQDLMCLASVMSDFKETFPVATIRMKKIDFASYAEKVISGEVSLALLNLSEPPLESKLLCTTLYPDPVILALPDSFSTASLYEKIEPQRSIRIAELQNIPFLLQSHSMTIRSLIDSLFAAHNIKPEIRLECDDTAALLSMTQQGMGISFLPASDQICMAGVSYASTTEAYYLQKSLVFSSDSSSARTAAACLSALLTEKHQQKEVHN